MKYSETGFRAIYKQFCAFPLSDSILSVAKDFPGIADGDCVLCYGYIDHEAGLTLENIAGGIRRSCTSSLRTEPVNPCVMRSA